jgi:hypothetical protein
MNSSWWKALIIVSLGLNCLIAGVLAYHFMWGRPFDRLFGGPPSKPPFLKNLPPENLASHALLREKMDAGRMKIHDARAELMKQLAASAPDRQLISEQLAAINKMQADMERMAVDQMLQDVQVLPPEKRQAFLDDIERGFFFRRGDGPGPGMGMGRPGRGRHRAKDFPPP